MIYVVVCYYLKTYQAIQMHTGHLTHIANRTSYNYNNDVFILEKNHLLCKMREY